VVGTVCGEDDTLVASVENLETGAARRKKVAIGTEGGIIEVPAASTMDVKPEAAVCPIEELDLQVGGAGHD
jgi:hypothetical protein